MSVSQSGKRRELEDLDIVIRKETQAIQDMISNGNIESENVKDRKKMLALALNDRGMLWYRHVEFDKAVADYASAVTYDDSLAAAYFNRGTIHYRLGDFGLAMADMSRAVSLEPENEEFQKGYHESKIML
ncbi:TPR repeat-containing protein slr0751-like [Ornithodoros turicata]|uniref:TPR repeat-containing protein slr0751-like n=1 Tax=Ornithodoros turicata TaxID=34597 RepID=UPI003139DEA5